MTNKKLILKADDFHFTNRDDWKNESWTRYFDYIQKNKLHTNVGVIPQRFEFWDYQFPKSKFIKYYVHGLTHLRYNGQYEFNGSFEQQLNRLKRSKSLMNSFKLDFDTFGAPWNVLDNNTIMCLELLGFKKCFIDSKNINLFDNSHIEPIKVNMGMEILDTNTLVLNPSFQKFIETYKTEEDICVLEHHPANWKNLEEFDKIIQFLKKEGLEL